MLSEQVPGKNAGSSEHEAEANGASHEVTCGSLWEEETFKLGNGEHAMRSSVGSRRVPVSHAGDRKEADVEDASARELAVAERTSL